MKLKEMNKKEFNTMYGAKLERNSKMPYKLMRNSVYGAK